MMTVVKQTINTIYMYVYLLYYTERLRRDQKFMFKEALAEKSKAHTNTMKKLAEFEREFKWKV